MIPMILEDDLYIVIGSLGVAIALDETGTPYHMPLTKDGIPDWENDWDIEWLDLTSTQYPLYKIAVQSLQEMSQHNHDVSMFVKFAK